jgi:hypothetical protein
MLIKLKGLWTSSKEEEQIEMKSDFIIGFSTPKIPEVSHGTIIFLRLYLCHIYLNFHKTTVEIGYTFNSRIYHREILI